MSWEDSLSQSILQPSAVHEHMSPHSTDGLFNEVESIQKEILDQIKTKSGEPCQVKIARIKEILQQVTKELTAEKQTLSSWKVSMSQSQLENNLTQDSIKERANKLMLHQKRLLSAFQRQKSISDVLRDKKYEESQVNSTLSAPKRLSNQDESPFTISETRVCEESSQLSQESDFLPTKSKSNPTLTQTSPDRTKRGTRSQTDFGQNLSSKQNGMEIDNDVVQTTLKISDRDFNTGNDNQKPALGTAILTSKTPVEAMHKFQAKQPAIDGNKKSTKARKRYGQKLQQCPSSTIAQSNKLDNGQLQKATPGNTTADQNSECSVLHFLEETEPTKAYDTGSLDVSKLKFIVMPKDEEFLDSSAIMPIDFWDSDIHQAVAIDSGFLKAMDFH